MNAGHRVTAGGRHVRFVGGRKAGTGAASEAMWEERKKK